MIKNLTYPFVFIFLEDILILLLILYSISPQTLFSSGKKMTLLFLDTPTVPNHLVYFVKDCLVVYAWLSLILYHLIPSDVLTFIPVFSKDQKYVNLRHV